MNMETLEIKIGERVRVHPQLTSDPYLRRGQVGKIVHIENETITLEFIDGQKGMYSDDTLIMVPDELNPFYLFSTTRTYLLSLIAKGEIDAKELALNELVKRGLDINGDWKGFNK